MYPINSVEPIPYRNQRYPFGEMEVGDSFLAPLEQWGSLRTRASQWKRKHNGSVVFQVKRVLQGIRVWRIA